MLLAGVELDQQPSPSLTHPEEGCVQPVEDVYVLGDGQHVVWHPQEGGKLPGECSGTLALPQEVLKASRLMRQCLPTLRHGSFPSLHHL